MLTLKSCSLKVTSPKLLPRKTSAQKYQYNIRTCRSEEENNKYRDPIQQVINVHGI